MLRRSLVTRERRWLNISIKSRFARTAPRGIIRFESFCGLQFSLHSALSVTLSPPMSSSNFIKRVGSIPIFLYWIIAIGMSADQTDHQESEPPPTHDWPALAQAMATKIAHLEAQNEALVGQVKAERDQLAKEREFYCEERAFMSGRVNMLQQQIDAANQELQKIRNVIPQSVAGAFHSNPQSPLTPPLQPLQPISPPGSPFVISQALPTHSQGYDDQTQSYVPPKALPARLVLAEKGGDKPAGRALDQKKFKTKFCKKMWEENGPGCEFGSNCAFAHNYDELQKALEGRSEYPMAI